MNFIKLSHTLTLLALLTLLAYPPLLRPAYSAPADKERITLDFKDVELTDLINTVSELTGKNFLYDESVRGKVTIVSPETMTLDETYQLFLTVLNVKGYTIVPSGKVNKIVSTKTARQEGLPVYSNGRSNSSDQFITRMVRLEYLDVDTVATAVLAPLMPATGNIITYAPTNTLILTETAATIDRMVTILQKLDKPDSSGDLEVIPLKYANAEEVAKIAQDILEEQATATRRRSNQKISTTQENGSKILPYPRTNSLIVVSNAEDLAKIKNLVALLDKEVGEEEADINVYYLENADAETLAATLNEILTGVKAAQTQKDTTKTPATSNSSSAISSQPVTITADKPTNSLIINAQQKDYAAIKNIIRKLDIKRKQVYVEALILELSMDATKALGTSLTGAIDVGSDSAIFAGTGSNTTLGNLTSSEGLLSQSVNGILLGGLFNTITVTGPDGTAMTVPAISALINLSKTTDDVNILSAPRLLTSDNEEAEIIVGDNVPIVTEKLTDTTSTNVTVSVERQDAALTLRFTPQVIEDNLVRLNIYQEVTGVKEDSQSDTNGPTLTKRVIRNTVLAQSRKTIILGGLINNQVTKNETKVPLLGDIPVIGWLFKSKSTTSQKKNLLVFITPTIVKDADDVAEITEQNRAKAAELLTEEQRKTLPNDFNQEAIQNNTPKAPQADGDAK
ncbi:type II secretion system secretin GspD [Pelobacter seleniigenes]|uniref:type II secretion system secretin GspD n=1 Tax=Pelobacter seleniigenes TaxID=407188 RepID=UPI0004A6B2F7|nr:type II secretion system secretin GspD [Pelobacter seleniigenes]